MKGISPMIATVLLIAFTIAVGGILSIWLTGYTRTTTEAVGGGTEAQIKCAASILSIKKVTNATDENVTILAEYSSGSESLTSVGCITIGDGKVSNKSTSVSPSTTVNPGTTFYCSINSTAMGGPTNDKLERVRVTATCLGEIPITVDCTPGKTCWG
jgi:flagellin-like protein